MIAEYFDDDRRFGALLAEIESWEGTKHAHRDVCIKGGATNCGRWAEAVLVRTGAIDAVKFPPYVTRNGGPRMLEVVMETLDNVPKLERVWKAGDDAPAPLPHRGRLLVISTGRNVHHLALIASPPTVWDCLDEVGERNYFDSTIRNHLFAVYRAVYAVQ